MLASVTYLARSFQDDLPVLYCYDKKQTHVV